MFGLDQSPRYACRSTSPPPPAPLPRSGFVQRPNKGLCNGASPCIGPHFANYPVAILFRFLDARCIQYHANSLLWPIPHREVSATLEPVQRRSRESLDRAIRLLR